MHYYEVAPNRIIRSDNETFTYASKDTLSAGTIVHIPVGKKTYVGVVMRQANKPTYETKEIIDLIEDTPLPQQLVELATWLSDYYLSHLSNVLQTILPSGVQKSRRQTTETPKQTSKKRTNFLLNTAQKSVVKKITSSDESTVILHGITGSGKTNVYVELARQSVSSGKSAIILVPEISLTSQMVADFISVFPNVIVTHSRQTEAMRHIQWQKVLTSKEPLVVIGPRSALFMPIHSLGLVVVDEFHEPSFKQEQSPRYSALRAASILTKAHNAKLILGSATPTISEYYLAESTDKPILVMDKKAQTGTLPSNVKLVDLTQKNHFKKHRFLSDKLISAIEESLLAGKQSLVFHNRRGSTNITLCDSCGWTSVCDKCLVPLTLHSDTYSMVCHICRITKPVPSACPTCRNPNIVHKGIGTKLIESELRKLFPKATIVRFDGDNSKTEDVASLYERLLDGSIDIIVGTQVIAKGLDLPLLRTVGVVQADAGLFMPDYSASERTFQLLSQVIGRVGRTKAETEVIVQSYQPTHPAISYGLNQDFTGFYTTCLKERQVSNFPPFTFLLKIVCIYKTEQAVIKNISSLKKTLSSNKSIEILGPTPSFYERVGGSYRWQLVVKSKDRKALATITREIPANGHWQFELDPTSLI